MLCIHFLQHWFELSDPAAEEALYESRAMRQFVGIDLGQEPVPDETTICKFRHLMERYNLGDELFRLVNVYLEENGLKLSRGTIVDASIISAPSSTKNKARARDPEMHQTRKGNQWCVSRTQASGLWCCTEDGRWPPETGLQEQVSNRPVLLRSKGVVVSDRGKVAH
jgi:IS5 family transposase